MGCERDRGLSKWREANRRRASMTCELLRTNRTMWMTHDVRPSFWNTYEHDLFPAFASPHGLKDTIILNKKTQQRNAPRAPTALTSNVSQSAPHMASITITRGRGSEATGGYKSNQRLTSPFGLACPPVVKGPIPNRLKIATVTH